MRVILRIEYRYETRHIGAMYNEGNQVISRTEPVRRMVKRLTVFVQPPGYSLLSCGAIVYTVIEGVTHLSIYIHISCILYEVMNLVARAIEISHPQLQRRVFRRNSEILDLSAEVSYYSN